MPSSTTPKFDRSLVPSAYMSRVCDLPTPEDHEDAFYRLLELRRAQDRSREKQNPLKSPESLSDIYEQQLQKAIANKDSLKAEIISRKLMKLQEQFPQDGTIDAAPGNEKKKL